MGGARGSDPAGDLRAPRRASVRRGRARRRAAGHAPGRVPAPEGAEGRRPRGRPPGREAADLSRRSRRAGAAAGRARGVLDEEPRRVQGHRRTTRGGHRMNTETAGTTDTNVRTSIVVDAPIERAFDVFTTRFGSFKPRDHNLLGGVDIAETVFEPRVGGHLYDRGVDGSECRFARVLAYEPPHRVVISWDISPQWLLETDLAKTSEVEVRFVPEAPDRTRVELEHRNLDRHGEGWQAVRAGVDGDDGWPLYLRRFADVAA